jgi:hypothetical protein
MVGNTWSANFTSPTPSARPRPGRPSQPRKKACQLPERVEAEAAGHDGVALEMAAEEPKIGLNVEFGADVALAIGAALFADIDNAIEHEHGRQRQLRIALTEQFAATAGEQILIVEAGALFAHFRPFPLFGSPRAAAIRKPRLLT